MLITHIGHACFSIEKDGYKVIVDPYETGSVPGLKSLDEEADMVLCSHQHFDHNAVAEVKIREGGVCPFTITKIESFHDEVRGSKRGDNTIHIFDDGVTRVAHLGDIGCDINEDMTEEERAMLTGLDAMMIPVGGTFTVDAEQAAAIIRQLNPKIAIPMHYRSDYYQFGFDMITTEEDFIAAYGDVMKKHSYSIDSEEQPIMQVNILRVKNAEKQV